MRIKIKTSNRGRVYKRTVNIPRVRGGAVTMSGKNNMQCLMEIKRIIQESMKEKGLTAEEARRSLGIKRYEK
jgi:hypothetical protein